MACLILRARQAKTQICMTFVHTHSWSVTQSSSQICKFQWMERISSLHEHCWSMTLLNCVGFKIVSRRHLRVKSQCGWHCATKTSLSAASDTRDLLPAQLIELTECDSEKNPGPAGTVSSVICELCRTAVEEQSSLSPSRRMQTRSRLDMAKENKGHC